MRQIRKAANIHEGLKECQCSEANNAAELQDTLGPSAVLRGHHHVKWVAAISDTYKKRVYPPCSKKSKGKRDKTALELSVTLVRECWNLFENMWAMRNDIMHKPNSAGAEIANKHLVEQLLDFKYNANEYLHYGDRSKIDYPKGEIIRWTRRSKEAC